MIEVEISFALSAAVESCASDAVSVADVANGIGDIVAQVALGVADICRAD